MCSSDLRHNLDADVPEQPDAAANGGSEARKPAAPSRRVTIHDIFESTEMSKLLKAIAAAVGRVFDSLGPLVEE